MKQFKKVTTVNHRNREFYILQDEKGFWAIESKWFDKNGVLTKSFNGLTGMLNHVAGATIKACKELIDYEYYVNECGMEKLDALKKVYG